MRQQQHRPRTTTRKPATSHSGRKGLSEGAYGWSLAWRHDAWLLRTPCSLPKPAGAASEPAGQRVDIGAAWSASVPSPSYTQEPLFWAFWAVYPKVSSLPSSSSLSVHHARVAARIPLQRLLTSQIDHITRVDRPSAKWVARTGPILYIHILHI